MTDNKDLTKAVIGARVIYIDMAGFDWVGTITTVEPNRILAKLDVGGTYNLVGKEWRYDDR